MIPGCIGTTAKCEQNEVSLRAAKFIFGIKNKIKVEKKFYLTAFSYKTNFDKIRAPFLEDF